ncbi:MAG: GerAB/ArcD/ProY family transporter [Deltaproteobacteria bacterium]
MNKIEISDRQLMIYTSGVIFGTAPLFLSSAIAEYAKQDSWISIIIATIMGLLVVWINTYLGGLYPNKTFIEIIQLLLGKWIGGFVSINFILMSFIICPQIIWYVGDFFATQYLTLTPLYVINILFTIVISIALLYGIETMFRTTEIFFAFAFPLLMISMFLLLPNANVDNLFPIMENGISPALKGSVPFISLAVFLLIFLNMIYPVNFSNINKAKKATFKGFLLGMFSSSVIIVMCILVLGSNITAISRFPIFLATKEIDVGIIFTRLETIITFIWLTTSFISVFTVLYGGITGLSQLLKLKDYRKIVLPIGLLIGVLSGFIYKDVPYQINWDTFVWTPYGFTFGVALPVVLLIISCIRKWLTPNQASKKP